MEMLNNVANNSEINQAVITLGGIGSRLSTITKGVPKPLYKIFGESTLERAIKVLKRDGINNFIFLTGYKSDLFKIESEKYKKDYGIEIYIHSEESKKGEAGSLLDIINYLDRSFLFINGDIIFDVDINRLVRFHNINNADITITTHLTNHPEDSDCIIEKPSLGIFNYKFKNETKSEKGFYLGNAGIGIISKNIIETVKENHTSKNTELSLFRDFVIYAQNNNFRVLSYNTSEYLKDMGTPKRLSIIKDDLKKNIISKKSYVNSQKALFLDRDNTIIECNEGEYITNVDRIIILKGRIKNIIKISKDFDIILIVSNQPQISMGKISWQDVIKINGEIIYQCQLIGLSISASYICPHHSHDNFKNEIKELKVNCFCRKPKPGLFYEAAFDRNIDLKRSLMIGDSWRDEKAATNCGVNFLHAKNLD